MSLFSPLIDRGFTTLKIRYNWKKDELKLATLKEWDEDTNWERYNKDFNLGSILTNDYRTLGTFDTLSLYNSYGLLKSLEKYISSIKMGRHFGVDFMLEQKGNIRFINCIHSSGNGMNNKFQAIRGGGMRRHDLNIDEEYVITDGLKLSQAMSFKNTVAEIPCGGSKIVVHSKPIDLEDMRHIGFLSYALDTTRSFTGPDMGYPVEIVDVMNKNFTSSITHSTGKETAYGVFNAILEAVKLKYGKTSLRSMTVAVQGLGAAGLPLVEMFMREGAVVYACNSKNENTTKYLIDKYGKERLMIVDKNEILSVTADIFCPAAMGGVIKEENMDNLKFSIIMGIANNDLDAFSQEQECTMARKLSRLGILYQCSWYHNIGGMITGWEEYTKGNAFDREKCMEKIKKICSTKTLENLIQSKDNQVTPTENAYKSVENIIYK